MGEKNRRRKKNQIKPKASGIEKATEQASGREWTRVVATSNTNEVILVFVTAIRWFLAICR